MHVLLIVIGLLLMLFGGGCVLIIGGLALADFQSTIRDMMEILPLIGFMGFLPLIAGWLLFRTGMRIDREKRRKTAEDFRNSERKP